MNSFKGIFDSILSPHAPHVLTEASPPPSNFEEPPSMGVGGGGGSCPHVLNTCGKSCSQKFLISPPLKAAEA